MKLLPSKKARAKLAAKSRRLLLRVIRLEEEQVARALRKLAKKGRRVAAKVIARAWKQSLLLRKVYPPPPPKLYISPVRRVLAKVFKPVVTVGIPVPKTFPRDEQASPYRLRERSPARFITMIIDVFGVSVKVLPPVLRWLRLPWLLPLQL